MIVGRIKNDVIHTGLASRLRKLITSAFQVEDKDIAKLIADFYWKKGRDVNPDDFGELVRCIYNAHKPPIVLQRSMGVMASSVIDAFEKAGWDDKDFETMYKAGIKHVEKQKNK